MRAWLSLKGDSFLGEEDAGRVRGKAPSWYQKGAGGSWVSETEQVLACRALVFLSAALSVVCHPSPPLCFVIVYQSGSRACNLGKINTCPTIFFPPPKLLLWDSQGCIYISLGLFLSLCAFYLYFQNLKTCTRGKRRMILKF